MKTNLNKIPTMMTIFTISKSHKNWLFFVAKSVLDTGWFILKIQLNYKSKGVSTSPNCII